VTAENKHVRHVGDAMVVFRKAHVAPLFIAEPPRPEGKLPLAISATADVHVYTSFDLRPPRNRDGTRQLVGTRQCWDGNVGKVVWLAPAASRDSHAIVVKRRLARRERDVERKVCRQASRHEKDFPC